MPLPRRSFPAMFAVCISVSTAPAFAGISVKLDGIPETFKASSVQGGFGVPAKEQRGQVACSDFTIGKALDDATVPLAQAVAIGQFIPTGTVTFARAEAGVPFTYYIIGMTNIRVTGFSQNSGGDGPDETVSLKAGAITLTYIANPGATPQSFPVSCAKN